MKKFMLVFIVLFVPQVVSAALIDPVYPKGMVTRIESQKQACPPPVVQPPVVIQKAKPNPFYMGVGFAKLSNKVGISRSTNEDAIFASSASSISGATRTENKRSVAKDIFMGYKFSDNFAAELGYIGGDQGATATTIGTRQYIGPGPGGTLLNTMVPFSDIQRSTKSAWHLSLLGEMPTSDWLKVLGRVGVMRIHTELEERFTVAWPATAGWDGSSAVWNSSSNKTTGFVGLGLDAKIASNFELRVEVIRSSVFSAVMITNTVGFR